jgi:transcriptional regulator with XRE-family HTH domain
MEPRDPATSRQFITLADKRTIEDAGQRLKKVRERLGLRYRDVEQASLSIAQRKQNDEFAIALSRLADIENKGTIPTIYRLYSLCAIYRLDLTDVLRWYGVDVSALPAEAAQIELEKTHVLGFGTPGTGSVPVPLALDPGIDFRRTTHLSRLIQRWGTLPLMLLNAIDLPSHRYGFIGTEDWWMYPLITPGSLIMIDETKRKPGAQNWSTEFERPIYFFEHREGYICSWCTLDGGNIVLHPHPSSMYTPQVYAYPAEIDIIGQVVGVAMRLDQGRKRRARS